MRSYTAQPMLSISLKGLTMSRVEKILQHIIDGTTVMDPSMSRVEYILKAIAGENEAYGVPLSRIEKMLQKWNGETITLEPPQSRIELILYKIIGEEVELKEPLSRVEELLIKISEGVDTVLEGLVFDGDCWFDIPIILTGDDVVRFTYKSQRSSCNLMGSYINSLATNNFSFYHGTSIYARYGDQLLRMGANAGEVYSVATGANGLDFNDAHDSFIKAEFTCGTDLYIGRLPNSSQAMFKGSLIGPIAIDNRMTLVPVMTSEGEYGYRDTITGVFYANQGDGALAPYE